MIYMIISKIGCFNWMTPNRYLEDFIMIINIFSWKPKAMENGPGLKMHSLLKKGICHLSLPECRAELWGILLGPTKVWGKISGCFLSYPTEGRRPQAIFFCQNCPRCLLSNTFHLAWKNRNTRNKSTKEKHLIPSSKLTKLAGISPFLIGNTSSIRVHFPASYVLVCRRVSISEISI